MSNIIMMVILLALVFVLAFYILRIFVTTYISNSIESIEKPIDDSISVYELQILFDGVIDMVTETDGKIEQYRYYNRILDYLNATRTLTYITMNNEPLYITEGYQADEILSVAAEYNASVLNHEFRTHFFEKRRRFQRVLEVAANGHNANVKVCNPERLQKRGVRAVADLRVCDDRQDCVHALLVFVHRHHFVSHLVQFFGNVPTEAPESD